MINFAPVAPLPLLKDLFERDKKACGFYHLLLAHDVLEHQEDYKSFFQQLRHYWTGQADHMTVIMDNSIVELGDAMNMLDVCKAAGSVGANVVVLPDVMGNGYGTEQKTAQGLTQIIDHYGAINKVPFDLMAVPQGPKLQDFARCLETFRQFPNIRWIGIPRIAVSQIGTRCPIAMMARAIDPDWKLHFLGFSDDVMTDVMDCQMCSKFVTGIDSAVPVRAGQKGKPFRLSISDYGKRENYWESTKAEDTTLKNIEYVRRLVGLHNTGI